MNKLFTTFLVAATSITFNANAQLVTISATHQMPVFGDTVHYVNANSFGFDPIGTGPVTNKVWDESGIFNLGTTYDFFYLDPSTISGSGISNFPAATIARGESGAAGYFYYQNTSNDINRIGWYGSASNYGIYRNGTFATEFHFPITAGNTVNSMYGGDYAPLGLGEDSTKIEQGSLTINADMQGTLILPTGTFTNVLRLHVIEEFLVTPYLLGTPVLNLPVQDDYFYWFIDTVLQPVLISGQTTVNGSTQTPVLRYQPISSSTGISNNVIKQGSVYPNPSNGSFVIKNNNLGSADYQFKIYNALGEKVNYSKTRLQSSMSIDMNDAPKGIYFLKIYEGQNIRTEKIIIQ